MIVTLKANENFENLFAVLISAQFIFVELNNIVQWLIL